MTIQGTTAKIQYIPCIINKQLNDHLGKLNTEIKACEYFKITNCTMFSKIKPNPSSYLHLQNNLLGGGGDLPHLGNLRASK